MLCQLSYGELPAGRFDNTADYNSRIKAKPLDHLTLSDGQPEAECFGHVWYAPSLVLTPGCLARASPVEDYVRTRCSLHKLGVTE
eukprot:573259-Hanusia_phi.AAC.1